MTKRQSEPPTVPEGPSDSDADSGRSSRKLNMTPEQRMKEATFWWARRRAARAGVFDKGPGRFDLTEFISTRCCTEQGRLLVSVWRPERYITYIDKRDFVPTKGRRKKKKT